MNVELVTDACLLRKRVDKPTFYRVKPIADCLTVIQCKVATLVLNRPIYVGFTMLELSKLHMYDFHYNHMKVKYPHQHCDRSRWELGLILIVVLLGMGQTSDWDSDSS